MSSENSSSKVPAIIEGVKGLLVNDKKTPAANDNNDAAAKAGTCSGNEQKILLVDEIDKKEQQAKDLEYQKGKPTEPADNTASQADATGDDAVKDLAVKLEQGETPSVDEAHKVQSEEQNAMGGARPPTGSTSAVAQSAVDKEQNFQKTLHEVEEKLEKDPSSVTNEDAARLHNLERRAHGQTATTKGSEVAEIQSKVAKEQNFEAALHQVEDKLQNDPSTVTKEEATRLASLAQRAHGPTAIAKGSEVAEIQSKITKEQNYQEAAAQMLDHINSAPETITTAEAQHLHRLDARAHGINNIQKDGITAKAQSLAAANERDANTANQSSNQNEKGGAQHVENINQTANTESK
ncbi:hypothetical protein M501DRAFT_1019037 [Patellaria atrata CBS 101060]|uniref:SMP domain-containing protein n=1 Tax=Patellaria atrata CBS 101060 TaxID=1346257 RepID=A0A9P4VNG0_9PEZI|nr:hypothetical protein M501DRAFT_1019037 [Patellaria atrata CBS 101060]